MPGEKNTIAVDDLIPVKSTLILSKLRQGFVPMTVPSIGNTAQINAEDGCTRPRFSTFVFHPEDAARSVHFMRRDRQPFGVDVVDRQKVHHPVFEQPIDAIILQQETEELWLPDSQTVEAIKDPEKFQLFVGRLIGHIDMKQDFRLPTEWVPIPDDAIQIMRGGCPRIAGPGA